VVGAAGIGLFLHLALNLFGGVENPAVSATYAIFAALGFGLLGLAVSRNAPNTRPVES
jgi:SSS family solute:Na+ symporter/sodium/pantothenate symporter